jgi:hypothetical protein
MVKVMGIEPIHIVAEHRIISMLFNFMFAYLFAFFEAISKNVEISTVTEPKF